jgi:mannose-6-phosphate isomerase
MTIEFARVQVMQRPWGVNEPGAWLKTSQRDAPIGEIWFERPGIPSAEPSLLLKLLFTSQPLSIQVHPDDAYAKSKGLPNGKTEAWYVLSAAPEAKVALGLKQRLTTSQLRQAAEDGSVSELVAWHGVSAGDAILVPAGTIHAVGAGLVIAEIQQRSDATYRLFDHGRQRELHIDDAIAVADTGPARLLTSPFRFTDERSILVCSPYFTFERIEFPPDVTWCLEAEEETWFLVLGGGADAGPFALGQADAIFMQSDCVDIRVGKQGLVALAAYTGTKPLPNLLHPPRHVEPAKQAGADHLRPPATTVSSRQALIDRHAGVSK